MPSRPAAKAARVFLFALTMAGAACHKQQPPVARPQPPPVTPNVATTSPTRPPAPPAPVEEPTVVPP